MKALNETKIKYTLLCAILLAGIYLLTLIF